MGLGMAKKVKTSSASAMGNRLKTERERAEALDRRRQRQIKLQGERMEAMRDVILSLAAEVRAIEQKHPEYTARSVDAIIVDAQKRVDADNLKSSDSSD